MARPLLDAVTSMRPGDPLPLTGPSGPGKSTLFRALAGIWPFGSGRIRGPPDEKILFLPQRPYLPLGTLRPAVAYPDPPMRLNDEGETEALPAAGLGHLEPPLDTVAPWARWLSAGEQQRLAIARALLARPDWLFLDEATGQLWTRRRREGRTLRVAAGAAPGNHAGFPSPTSRIGGGVARPHAAASRRTARPPGAWSRSRRPRRPDRDDALRTYRSVIARSEATRQSRGRSRGPGLLRFARNCLLMVG